MQDEREFLGSMISVHLTSSIILRRADDSKQCFRTVTCASGTALDTPLCSVFAKLLQPTAVLRVYHISSG